MENQTNDQTPFFNWIFFREKSHWFESHPLAPIKEQAM
jgi:hypothetical protein